MKVLVNFLNGLDTFFEYKSENEKWMMIAMVTVVIGYISYSFFYPFAEEKYNNAHKRNNSLKKSIASNKQYLQSISRNGNKNYLVNKYEDDIKKLEKKIEGVNDEISFISINLDDLSPLLFNKKSWSKFLNSITKQAKKQSVSINYIENKYVNNNGSFGHVLQIGVGCSGSYKNITKFINQLERSVLVTDIYGSHLYLDKNNTVVSADINISVWGINH